LAKRARNWEQLGTSFITDDWKNCQDNPVHGRPERSVGFQLSKLNVEQELFLRVVRTHVENGEQCLLKLVGLAGTGKTAVLSCLVPDVIAEGKIVFTGSTGIAASRLRGSTLYSVMKIPIFDRQKKLLTPQQVRTLQSKLSKCEWLVLDEYTMVDAEVFFWLDQRCKQVFGAMRGTGNKMLGGLNMIIAGDEAQLPPVMKPPAFVKPPLECTDSRLTDGFFIFRQFTEVVVLHQIFRQADPKWRSFLWRVRIREVPVEDHAYLMERSLQDDQIENYAEFDQATFIHFNRRPVEEFNMSALKKITQFRVPHERLRLTYGVPEDGPTKFP
jgi:ABC-type oligopeptide transport system ATPase subunit